MKQRIAGVLSATLLGFAILPRDRVACPAWDIYVQDQDARPLQGIVVRINSEDPLVEEASTSLLRTTDDRGHVSVPQRTVRASALRAAWGAVRQVPALVHASVVPFGYASIESAEGYGLPRAGESGVEGVYWIGGSTRVTSRLVLYRCGSDVGRVGCSPKEP